MKGPSSQKAGIGFLVAAAFLVAVAAWQFPKFTDSDKLKAPAASNIARVPMNQPASSTERPEEIEVRKFRQLSEQILKLLATDSAININKVYLELVPSLVKLDPEAAAAFANSQQNSLWRDQLMMVVAQSWAAMNPDDAQDWAANLQNPPGKPGERDTVVSYVSFEIAKTDPARAVKVLSDTNINADRREIMVENLAQQWARKDLQPLTDWIASTPAGAERDRLLARIANSQAQTDPERAAEIISLHIAPGPIQNEAALNIIRKWAWTDPEHATNWLMLFPRNDFYQLAMKELKDTVARRDGLQPHRSLK